MQVALPPGGREVHREFDGPSVLFVTQGTETIGAPGEEKEAGVGLQEGSAVFVGTGVGVAFVSESARRKKRCEARVGSGVRTYFTSVGVIVMKYCLRHYHHHHYHYHHRCCKDRGKGNTTARCWHIVYLVVPRPGALTAFCIVFY